MDNRTYFRRRYKWDESCGDLLLIICWGPRTRRKPQRHVNIIYYWMGCSEGNIELDMRYAVCETNETNDSRAIDSNASKMRLSVRKFGRSRNRTVASASQHHPPNARRLARETSSFSYESWRRRGGLALNWSLSQSASFEPLNSSNKTGRSLPSRWEDEDWSLLLMLPENNLLGCFSSRASIPDPLRQLLKPLAHKTPGSLRALSPFFATRHAK